MNIKLYTFFMAGISALVPAALQAQDVLSDTAHRRHAIADVVIQERRLQIPFSEQNRNVTILDRKVIESLPVNSVNELLAYVAGIDVRQRGPQGTQADISINGGSFDQTLVLLNGVKMTDPQSGHNMMNLPVSLEAVARIEILKGAAASVYGINAINGAINIITRQPEGTGVTANVYAGSSFAKDTSNDKTFWGWGTDLTASLQTGSVGHMLAVSTAQSTGYRYNSAFDNKKIYYQNQIPVGAGTLQMMGGYVANDFGANGFYAAPADVESKETVQTAMAGVMATIPVTGNWDLRPYVGYRYNFDHYMLIRQKPEVYENLHYTNVLDLELNNTITTGVGVFGLGLAFRTDIIRSSNLGDWNRKNYGIYGEYSFTKVANLTVNIGAFANYNDEFGFKVYPAVDAGYDITDHFRAFACIGTGERQPTYTDLYYVSRQNIGNPDLIPEKAVQAEAGLKFHDKGWTVAGSFFHRAASDLIDWVKDSVAAPWQPRNYQQVRTSGLSFSADYRLWRPDGAALSTLLAGLSYTWLDPHVEDDLGEISKYALDNLRHQLVVRATAGFFKRFQVTLAGRFQQRISYKDYVLWDARLAYRWERFELYANGSNLSNQQYKEAGAVPLPGRWLSIGLKWAWQKK